MAQAARQRYSYSYRGASASSRTASTSATTAASAANAAPQKSTRERYRVIPGEGKGAQRAKGLPKRVMGNFWLLVAAVVVLAVISIACVFTTVVTLHSVQSATGTKAAIEQARAAGDDLEIQHSALANPERIQREATKLGMSAPKNTERIAVSMPAETKMFENGAISISATIKSIENSAAGN